MKPLSVFFAVPDEAAGVLADSRYDWNKTADGMYASRTYPLKLTVSGVGKAFASFYFSKIADYADRVLIMGTSGGLSDEKVGALCLVEEFVEHDMDVMGLGFEKGVTPFCGMKHPVIRNCSDGFIIALAAAAGNTVIRHVRTVSGDSFIDDAQEALMLKTNFGAALVDMESAAIAKLCWKTGRDVAALRYITDNANHDSAVNWTENVKKAAVIFAQVLGRFIDAEGNR